MNATSYTTVNASPLARKRGQLLDGKWTLGRIIGRGGTACVYEGESVSGDTVAIKLLYPQLVHDPSHVERFRLEVELLGRLKHPTFVKSIDHGNSPEGLPYLVMELLDGATILEVGKPKPLEEVVGIVRNVLEALGEMHELGAVHRDIKPSNLHVTSEGLVKVLDLGIARAEGGEVTMTGMAVGTPGFMAPEQAWSKREDIGPSTDIFAVGATAIVLLNGGPVRHGTEILEAATCAFPTCAELGLAGDPEVLSVFDRAVRYAPAERFQSVKEMLDALDVAMGGQSSDFDGDTTLISTEPLVSDDTVTRIQPAPRVLGRTAPNGTTEPQNPIPRTLRPPTPKAAIPRIPVPPALPKTAGIAPLQALGARKPGTASPASAPDSCDLPMALPRPAPHRSPPPLPVIEPTALRPIAPPPGLRGAFSAPPFFREPVSLHDGIGMHFGARPPTPGQAFGVHHERALSHAAVHVPTPQNAIVLARTDAKSDPLGWVARGILRVLDVVTSTLRGWAASRGNG
jgi:eukaryotic-like serine/threonine-protein kinase